MCIKCGPSTVDITRNLLPRELSIVLKDSVWMGYHNGRLNSTRARFDHVANDH